MKFELTKAMEVLERTPEVLSALLSDLPDHWTRPNEGGDSWNPYTVIGHLIHGEKTDWMVRTHIILEQPEKPFDTYDRFAQLENDQAVPIDRLLEEFAALRKANLADLAHLKLAETELNRTGIHPRLGKVTLAHLLAAWVVHDLSHLAQIARVMAFQYKTEVGPWVEYMPILHR